MAGEVYKFQLLGDGNKARWALFRRLSPNHWQIDEQAKRAEHNHPPAIAYFTGCPACTHQTPEDR